MMCEMDSRSERISARFLVPSTFRKVVAASSRVEWLRIEAVMKVVKLPFVPFEDLM